MRRDMHGPPPLPLGLGANPFIAVQQGHQFVNMQIKQHFLRPPLATNLNNTSTSTSLGVKRTHSNNENSIFFICTWDIFYFSRER